MIYCVYFMYQATRPHKIAGSLYYSNISYRQKFCKTIKKQQ